MLAFVTSLRHPWNSDDYSRIDTMLGRTLRSICRQADDRFVVIVIGNQAPDFPLPPRVEFVQVDYPPPSAINGPKIGREAVQLDKGTKLALGLSVARKHAPTHVMFFDADDLVSARLSQIVAADPEAPGWYFRTGYLWAEGTGVIRKVGRFHRICGTSFIFRTDLFPAAELSMTASQDEVLEAYGDFTVRKLIGSHRHAYAHFRETGHALAPLPFAGAVYVLGTGENQSGRAQTVFAVPLRNTHIGEFGLPLPTSPRGVLGETLRSYGPVTLTRHAISRTREEVAAQLRSTD